MNIKYCPTCKQLLPKPIKTDNLTDKLVKQGLINNPECNTIPLIIDKVLRLKYNKHRANKIANSLRSLGYSNIQKRKENNERVYVWIKPDNEDYTQDL
jgi:hypothetical protein